MIPEGEDVLPAQTSPSADLVSSDGDTVDLLVAAFRADNADLATFERVLFASLEDSLPPGVVEIDRNRSMGDRVAGRPGRATAIRVHLGEEVLELESGRSAPVARIAKVVRGVVISRKEVSVGEWTLRFAQLLQKLAKENAATRDALARLLGTT